MKTKHLITAVLLGLTAIGSAWADTATPTNAKVKVDLLNPEKFTDVRDAFQPTDKGQLANAEAVRDYIAQKTADYVPDGCTLTVSVTNIDLAGDFEPWGKPGAADVRIVKDIYPPRIDLSFKLVDAAGHVLKEGARELRDLNYLMKINIRSTDSYRHEKALIDDWVRQDFKPAKQG